jgi:hypothetical protein
MGKTIVGRICFHGFVILLGWFMLYPVFWMVFSSFKANTEIFNTTRLWPTVWHLDNYVRGWKFNNSITFTTFFKNSFFYTIVSTLGAVFASSLVAYGFSRIPFKGQELLVCVDVRHDDASLPGRHGAAVHSVPKDGMGEYVQTVDHPTVRRPAILHLPYDSVHPADSVRTGRFGED